MRAGAEPDRRLCGVVDRLNDADGLGGLCDSALDGILGLVGADFGNVQLRDAATGALRIVTHQGFDSEFLEYFAVVDDAHSACGRAANAAAQVVIVDVDEDHRFAPHRGIAAAAGFQAVQSTPLRDRSGIPLGVISTHWRRPHRPSDHELQLIRVVADRLGSLLSRRYALPRDPESDPSPVGAFPADHVLGSPAGRRVAKGGGDTLLSELVSYATELEIANVGLRDSLLLRETELLSDRERIAGELCDTIIARIFRAGLLLDAVRTLIKDPAAERRLIEAIDHLDGTIKQIRAATFSHGKNQSMRSDSDPIT